MRGLKLDLNNNFHSSPVALVRNKKNLDGIWKQEELKLLLVPVPFLWAKKRPVQQPQFSPTTEVTCKGLKQLHHQPPQADLLSQDQSWKQLLTGSLPPSPSSGDWEKDLVGLNLLQRVLQKCCPRAC